MHYRQHSLTCIQRLLSRRLTSLSFAISVALRTSLDASHPDFGAVMSQKPRFFKFIGTGGPNPV